MGSIFNRHYINRALLPIVLSTFTMTYALPLPAQQFDFGFNEVAFMIRLEKVVERLVKSDKKGTESILDSFIDVKQEIESSYNTKLDIDYYMNQVGNELKKQGQKVPKKDFESIKKMIKKKEKKAKNHARYLADTMYLEGYQMNEFDEDIMITAHRASKHDKPNQEEDKEEVVIPALLVYGVTVALCGMFLMVLPIPACKDWGGRMVVAGVTACANSLCTRTDENNKKEKDKR